MINRSKVLHNLSLMLDCSPEQLEKFSSMIDSAIDTIKPRIRNSIDTQLHSDRLALLTASLAYSHICPFFTQDYSPDTPSPLDTHKNYGYSFKIGDVSFSKNAATNKSSPTLFPNFEHLQSLYSDLITSKNNFQFISTNPCNNF